MRRYFALLPVLAGPLVSGAADAPVPLGSPEFRPSPERPLGWRGDGSGRFPGATPAIEWSETKNVRWSTTVGRSYSSPVVTDKFAFVTSEPNLLLCLNRTDGKERWRFPVNPADLTSADARKIAEDYKPPKDGSGMASATPITDGQTVYTVFANGIVCANDMEGKRKWITCIEAPQSTGYGRSASPILVAGKLIVHMTALYAFDPANGTQLWVNTDARSSYGTPAAIKANNVDVIVTPFGDVVQASDGKSLNNDIGHTVHSSPIPCGDGLICFGDSPVSALRFNTAFKEEEAWSGTFTGEAFGSPLLHDNTLYITTGDGELFTFNAAAKGSQEPVINGRALFQAPKASTPAAYASLTLAGKYIFLNSNKGEITVLAATPEAPVVSRIRMPAGTGSSPVFSGKDMFLRDGDKLYCVGE